MTRYYLGLNSQTNTRELFAAQAPPTEATHGDKYKAVVGPFKTKRGAALVRDHGQNNPHVQTVNDAERLSKN